MVGYTAIPAIGHNLENQLANRGISYTSKHCNWETVKRVGKGEAGWEGAWTKPLLTPAATVQSRSLGIAPELSGCVLTNHGASQGLLFPSLLIPSTRYRAYQKTPGQPWGSHLPFFLGLNYSEKGRRQKWKPDFTAAGQEPEQQLMLLKSEPWFDYMVETPLTIFSSPWGDHMSLFELQDSENYLEPQILCTHHLYHTHTYISAICHTKV